MSEKTRSHSRKRNRNVWSISGLRKRCQQLIQEGLLSKKKGLKTIVNTINTEFSEQLAERNRKFSQKTLTIHLSGLIWTRNVEDSLWEAISHGLEEKFGEMYSYIPQQEIARKSKALKGLTHSPSVAEFKAGMGRLSTEELPPGADAFEFPEITYQKPFVMPVSEEWQVPIINGALIGIAYPPIERNTLRRSLADARNRQAQAVILTNLFDLWTKKTAGFLAVYRARVSGIRVNPERFPADYRQEVRDILKGKITDRMIYQTLNERFIEIVDGLAKISCRPDVKDPELPGLPEFPGPVFILLGLKEEELIKAATYYECRYMTIIEQTRIQAELDMARNRFAEAKTNRDQAGMAHWSREIKRLGARKSRAIITNHTGPQYEQIERRIRALVVHKLETAIPNSKVISQGGAYLKFGNKIVKVVLTSDDSVSDGCLAAAGDTYGGDVFNDTLADLTVVCPPCSLNHRDVGREDSKDGQPITKYMHVAPSCLDRDFLRREFRGMTKGVHPVQALVFDPQFEPGVLMLSHANDMLSADKFPIARLGLAEDANGKNGKNGHTNFAFPYPGVKYITYAVNTDSHWGSASKRFIWDPEQRIHLGVNEAAVEMMRRAGVLNPSDIRIHGIAELDDATNGCMWFKPHFQPHPREMSIIQIEKWINHMGADIRRAAEAGDNEAVTQLTQELSRTSIAQMYFRGDHFPFHQMMQVYDRHLDPLVDYYGAVLGRFIKSGIVMRGLSEINRTMSDTRDVGVLNFPNGNHRVNTLERADLEGEYFARHIRAKLESVSGLRRYLKNNPGFLEKAVRAPRFANTTFGLGTIKAPGGYEWALRLLSAPPRLSSWSDLLAAFVRSDLARGDSSYGLLKYRTITLVGDKHFYCKAETNRITYILCAAGTHTDLYGDTGGFPPNNTGVCFVSMPADGPDAGPILVRKLSHDYIRDWFANPKPFDWNKFLPNPV